MDLANVARRRENGSHRPAALRSNQRPGGDFATSVRRSWSTSSGPKAEVATDNLFEAIAGAAMTKAGDLNPQNTANTLWALS